MNKINPQFVCDMFDERELPYNLRNSNLLLQHRFKTVKYGYKSFMYYGAKLWNALPSNLKEITKLHIFKQHLSIWCTTTDAAKLEIF